MKNGWFLGLFLVISLSVLGQERKIDDRLLQIFEQSTIEKIHNQRPDYYFYLVYELDNRLEIISKKDSKGAQLMSIEEVKNSEGIAFDSENLDLLKSTNWKTYSFQNTHQQAYFYKLPGGKVLKVLSGQELEAKYKASPEFRTK